MVHGHIGTCFMGEYGYGADERHRDMWIPPVDIEERNTDLDNSRASELDTSGLNLDGRPSRAGLYGHVNDMLLHCKNLIAKCECDKAQPLAVAKPEYFVACGKKTPWVKCVDVSVDRGTKPNVRCTIPPETAPISTKNPILNGTLGHERAEWDATEEQHNSVKNAAAKKSHVVTVPLLKSNDKCFPGSCPGDEIKAALNQCPAEQMQYYCACQSGQGQQVFVRCMRPNLPKTGLVMCDKSSIARGVDGDKDDRGFISCTLNGITHIEPYLSPFGTRVKRGHHQVVDRCKSCAPALVRPANPMPDKEGPGGLAETSTVEELRNLDTCTDQKTKLACKCMDDKLVMTAQCTSPRTPQIQCDPDTSSITRLSNGRAKFSCHVVTKVECKDWSHPDQCHDSHRIFERFSDEEDNKGALMAKDDCGSCTGGPAPVKVQTPKDQLDLQVVQSSMFSLFF